MKTLDEVIKALEICTSGYCSNPDGYCPYLNIDNDCDTRLRKLDALEYLKKLKRIEAKIEKIAIGNVEDTLSKMDNPPLTWDELKTMEGKPVWLERTEKYCVPRWAIVDEIYKWDSIDDSTVIMQPEDEELFLSDLGKSWQAYRKERHEG